VGTVSSSGLLRHQVSLPVCISSYFLPLTQTSLL
jgi:hypothetical protein